MDTQSKSWTQIQSYWRQKSNSCRKHEHNSSGYRLAMLATIKQRIAYDAYCFTLTDPFTLLSTGALTDPSLQQLHEQLLITEYANHNHWSYEEMVRHNRFVTRLSDIKGSRAETDMRCQKLLAPAGFSDEMRAALFYEGQCWGFLTLFKRASNEDDLFSQADELQMNALMPIVAEALMHYYYSSDDLPAQPRELEYGFLLLSEQLHIISSNERGNKLLYLLQQAERLQEHHSQDDLAATADDTLSGQDDLAVPTADMLSDQDNLTASANAKLPDQVANQAAIHSDLPKPIQALGYKLLANHQQSQQLSLFIPLSSNQYITLNAALLHSVDPDSSLSKRQIAITIEEASPNSMLTYFMQRYKLTPREQQMVYELLKGSSNKEMAAHLEISSHTVQDHLKSIFAKTEVSSRSELIWKLHTRFSLASPLQQG